MGELFDVLRRNRYDERQDGKRIYPVAINEIIIILF